MSISVLPDTAQNKATNTKFQKSYTKCKEPPHLQPEYPRNYFICGYNNINDGCFNDWIRFGRCETLLIQTKIADYLPQSRTAKHRLVEIWLANI